MTDILINSWTKGVLESVGAATGGELLPCPNPWCHSAVRPMPFIMRDGQHKVICGCDFHGPAADSRDEAITVWNTRLPLSDSLTNGGSSNV